MSTAQPFTIFTDKPMGLYSFTLEYFLLALFLVILTFKNGIRKYFARVRFRAVELKDVKYYDFDNLPGPSSLPIIGSLHHLPTEFSKLLDMMLGYGKRFGPVVGFEVFHEKFIALNNAPMCQTLLQSTEMGHWVKTPIVYEVAFKNILGKGLVTSTGEHWKMQRKLLSPAFSFKSFQNYCRLFFKYSSKLVSDLDVLFQNTGDGNVQTRQINSTIHLCTMQIISEAVIGLDLCSDEDGMKFYDGVRRVKELFGKRLNKYVFLLDFFWRFHPLYNDHVQTIKTVNSVSTKMIRKYRLAKEDCETSNCESSENENSKGKTMIEEMMKAGMSDTEILHEVNTLIFAGFETTGATVHFLMFMLALNQEHQKLCREEIDAIYADPMKCKNGELTFDAVSDMKYVERCVQETLRKFPPVMAVLRTLAESIRLDETLVVPSGTTVMIPILSLHQNPDEFPNPEKFDPDRFLPENIQNRHPFSYIPFSAGPRNCIGLKFAMMSVKLMAAYIVRHFEVYTTDGVNDVKMLPNIFMTPERDYNFILKRRQDIPFTCQASNNNQY